MSDNYNKHFEKIKYDTIKANLLGHRLDPFIRQLENKDGKNKGLIFPFARGLRFSALLIYTIRECLSGSTLEANWGQIINEDGDLCSGECDIIIHKKGYLTKWNGNDQGNHIMDFRFIEQKNAIAVISCKSYLTKTTVEKEYCENMLNFVKKIWLFAECIGPESKDLINDESKKIGYENFWYLYTWSRTTGNTEDDVDGWHTFVEAVKNLKDLAYIMPRNEIKVIDTWTQNGHSIYCKDFGPFLSLQQHSFNMNRFLVSHNQYDENKIANWFHLASGINRVDYSSDLFDSTSMWCRPAYEYEEEKSKFHSRLITELTRFTFIWGGFEAFIDSLNLQPCPFKQGKINSVNHFLNTHFSNLDNSILFYNELTQFFKKIISKNPWYGNVNELFASEKCVSENYIALKVVYKIRNSFAHGAFQFSEPAEWSRTKPLDILIISISSRLVLLTMQLLIIAKYEKLKFRVTQPDESYEDGLIASKYIRLMHLKIIEKNVHN